MQEMINMVNQRVREDMEAVKVEAEEIRDTAG
jgi:hypothetical protein